MKNKSKKLAVGGERRITLKMNGVLTNDPCAFCGGRCDPGGFDYFAEGTGHLVCDDCAKKYAPEMVNIQKAALNYAKRDREIMARDIQRKIKGAINEKVEVRIMRVFDEIYRDEDGIF